MASVKGPPPGPGSQPPPIPRKARGPAGKQAKGSPRGAYKRPHQVHTEEEERIAELRHHLADLDEEAHRRHILDTPGDVARGPDELEEEIYRVEGLNLDERRKKKGKQDGDPDEEDGEAAAEAAQQAARKKGLLEADGAGRYFQDMPEDRLGDPTLTNPNEMKRVLGATSRFAQHAMLLAQARIDAGANRGDAVAHLAKFYIDLGDREYARKALREFGPGTGILDIYPLEVIEHLLEFVPSFFGNIRRGRFFTSSTTSHYRAKAGEVIHLTYPPELKIRGFAIKGGARPGYLLEPTDPPGTYTLTFQTSGSYQILISAIGRGGAVFVEEMRCEIEEGETTTFDDQAAIKRERASEVEAIADEERAEKKKNKEKEKASLESDLQIHLKQRI